MAPEEEITRVASRGFLFVLVLTFLLGGCDWEEDPCVQHLGVYGTEPYYYYTGDCGEGVTMASSKQPSVPYMIQFDNSFLQYRPEGGEGKAWPVPKR